MMTGPTHNRRLSASEFDVGRQIHDYMVEEALKYGREVYEFDVAYESAMQHINRVLSNFLESRSK